jgi:hypothetical protein
MLSDPKSILFSTELKWPPFEEFGVSKDVVRTLYNKMFDPGGYTYDNLELQNDKPLLHRSTSNGRSMCQFGADSITIEENTVDCDIVSFVDIVKTVLGGLDQDDVPPFYLQRVRIQCLSRPTHCSNAVELLAGRASKVFDVIEPFERPPALFGMRFRFPPVHLVRSPEDEVVVEEGDAQNDDEADDIELAMSEGRVEEKAGFVVLRFESYAKDPQSVWMEAASTYPLPEPLALDDLEKITENIQTSYEFLTVNSKQFLDQFDVKQGDDDD